MPCDCGSIDCREGTPRRDHARLGQDFSRVRTCVTQRIFDARALRGARKIRPDAASPPELRTRSRPLPFPGGPYSTVGALRYGGRRMMPADPESPTPRTTAPEVAEPNAVEV